VTRRWLSPRGGTKTESMNDEITIKLTREQLGAYHSALGCAIDHAEAARGNQSKIAFVAALVELADRALIAIWDHDEVPQKDRDPAVAKRAKR
jgi:hypothetical protein